MASPSLDGMYLPGNEVDEGNYALYGNEADGLAVPMPSDERPIKENRDASEGAYFAHNEKQSITLITAMHISFFAILGAFLRIVLAQFFGEECANPGTVGWLAASSPLCVTADGSAESRGSIIFADLPANLIGSFFMGMLQSTATMGLPVSVPIAWMKVDSWFQDWEIVHLAMRTGFCGSLTTFSSWNSAMVVMMFGTGSDYTSQIVRAVFGYVVGMETALGSFVFGKKVAEWAFRAKNPTLWQEAIAIEASKHRGVYVNCNLPEFERQFLANLEIPSLEDNIDPDRLGFLERWRLSAESARRLGHEDLDFLNDIEQRILSDRFQVMPQDDTFCTERGWDLSSLIKWTHDMPPASQSRIANNNVLFTPAFSCGIVVIVYCLLLAGLLLSNGVTAYAVTHRTMVFALMWAPPGALIRWQLGAFNGMLAGDWSWLPAGTLAANVFGSMVSITAIAIEYVSPAKGFWKIGTLRSVKVGFAGSLTTVSTFVAEVHGFSSKQQTQDRAYIYMVISIATSCVLSMIIYAAICSGKGF